MEDINQLTEKYYKEQRDADARIVLSNLKIDLACRKDNEHVGSGLGGNPTDFWWMLNNPVKAVGMDGGLPYFDKVGSEVLFHSTKKPSMRDVRNALTKFLDDNYPNRQAVTQEQLTNLSFVKDWAFDKMEVKLFIQALEHIHELVTWLDLKIAMKKKLKELCAKEYDAVAICFLKEQGLPEDYFQTHKDDEGYLISCMLNSHPVWNVKREAIHKRYEEMIKQLISVEDNEKLEMCGAFPPHIALFAFRSVIQMERIISLNLDKLPSCNFFKEINGKMNSFKYKK